MPRSALERRLFENNDRLKRLRADLSVAREQVAFLDAEADDARLRALVSETPITDAEAREAQRHADAQRQQLEQLASSIAELEREQDALLDRMTAELS
ncbi:MAG TPA: hypothetical protein VGI86_06020 [Acidimicrobiia bacterium]